MKFGKPGKKHFGLQLSKAKAKAEAEAGAGAGAYEPFFCALLVPEIRRLMSVGIGMQL